MSTGDNILIPLLFLIIGGAFMFSLLKSLWALLTEDFGKEGMKGETITKLFLRPFIFFLIFLFFVLWGLPFLESTNI